MTDWLDKVKRHSLLPILLVGFLARLVVIQTRALQYDDVFSIFLSRRSLGEIVNGTAADTMPPLYYFLLHYWMMLGQAVWQLRLLSVLFSLAAVVLIYWLAKELFDPQTAAWAALLTALSPIQFYHSQDVRNYALLLALQLGYLFFFIKIWKLDALAKPTGKWNWVGLVLCATASLYTHNLAVLAFGLPDLFLLLKGRWKLLLRLVAAQALILLLTLPWLLLLPEQFAKVQRAWSLTRPGLVDIFQALIMFTAGLPLNGVWLAVGAVLSLEVFALVTLELVRRSKGNQGVLFMTLIALTLPGVLFALSYVVKPVFVPRGFLLSSTAYYGLIGWTITQTWQKGGGKVILAGFLVAALIGLGNQYTFNEFPRSPLREAAAALVQDEQNDEIVLHDNKLSYFPCRFYEPDLRQVFLPDEPGSGNDTFAFQSQVAMDIFPAKNIQAAVGDARKVYFVVFERTLDDYQAIGVSDHPVLTWLSQRYSMSGQTSYGDLKVFTFTKK